MNKKPATRWIILTVLLALNIGVLAWKWKSRNALPPQRTREQQQEEQASRVAKWSSDVAIALTANAEWMAAIQDSPTKGCLDVPVGVVAIDAADVSKDEQALLWNAVAGLLDCYIQNSPEKLIGYMAAQDEKPNPSRVEVVREMVGAMRRVEVSTLVSLTPEQVFSAYWTEAKIDCLWASILKESGCCVYWRTKEPPDEKVRQSLGHFDGSVFNNISQYAHNFSPNRSLNDKLKSDGSLLFADVKIVVRLKQELFEEPVPYFLRYWYDSTAKVWHPFQLGRVSVGAEAEKSQHFF